MARYVVYHTDPSILLGSCSIEREALAEIDAELRLLEPGLSPNELAKVLLDADAVLVMQAPMNAQVMAAMENCKVVVRYGVGVDTLDLDSATQHDIVCAHVPDFCMEEVANHALMFILATVRKLIPQDRNVRKGNWRENFAFRPTQHLYGQTLGLVAFGNIAQAVAKRAKALSMRVIAYDPYADADVALKHEIELVGSLGELLEQSDIVSLHTPKTPETVHLMNNEAFEKMKPTAFLVNTARGPIVEEEALINALNNDLIAGAALDVFEEEPWIASSALREMDNVIFTPHSASYSDASFERLSQRVAQSAVHVLTGCWPRYVANTAILDKIELNDCPDPP